MLENIIEISALETVPETRRGFIKYSQRSSKCLTYTCGQLSLWIGYVLVPLLKSL